MVIALSAIALIGKLIAVAFRATTITMAIVGRAINTDGNMKERGKEIILNMNQNRLRAITLQGTIEKGSI